MWGIHVSERGRMRLGDGSDQRGLRLLRVPPSGSALEYGTGKRNPHGAGTPPVLHHFPIRKRINATRFRPRSLLQRRRPLDWLRTLRLRSRDRRSGLVCLDRGALLRRRGWGRQSCRRFILVLFQPVSCGFLANYSARQQTWAAQACYLWFNWPSLRSDCPPKLRACLAACWNCSSVRLAKQLASRLHLRLTLISLQSAEIAHLCGPLPLASFVGC